MVFNEENEVKLLFSIKLVRKIRLLLMQDEKSPASLVFWKNFGSPMKEACGGDLDRTLNLFYCIISIVGMIVKLFG